MKICIVSEREYGCGASIATFRLVQALANAGHEVNYIFDQPFPIADNDNLIKWSLRKNSILPLDIFRFKGIRRLTYNFYIKLNLIQKFSVLRKLLDQIRPDVVNLHNVSTILSHDAVLELVREFPVVWTMHDLFAIKPYNYQFVNLANQTVETMVIPAKFVDPKSRIHLLASKDNIQFVSPSKWLKETVFSEIEKFNKKIHVIPNGLSQKDFFPEDKIRSRTHLGLAPDIFYALFIASNVEYERKNIQVLLDALQQLPEEIRILALGSVDSDFRHQYPCIKFFSSHFDVSLIRKLYSASDVFILPSLIDNLPNTVMESLFCGTPVIGADVGGVPEMVVPGKTGWLFNPRNPRELAAILSKVYQHRILYTEISSQCVDWAQQHFSIESQRDRYLELFLSMKGVK